MNIMHEFVDVGKKNIGNLQQSAIKFIHQNNNKTHTILELELM